MNRIISYPLLFLAGFLIPQTFVRSAVQDMPNNEQIILISASTFEFKPSEITVKKGLPVTLELVSMDRHHGFNLSGLHVRADIKPGSVARLRFVPDRSGTF